MQIIDRLTSSIPILIIIAVLIIALVIILIITKTSIKIGKFSFTPTKKIETHEACNLYKEHLYMIEEAFEDGVLYKEIEKPIYKRIRKMVAYKANALAIDYMYEAYHQVFHELHGRDRNLSDSQDYIKIMEVVSKLKDHSMDYTWDIIEDNHILDKIASGKWIAYRNSRIQESLTNVINYMTVKMPKLQDIPSVEQVKTWYERHSQVFVSEYVMLWDDDVVPLLYELEKDQKKIKEKYYKNERERV